MAADSSLLGARRPAFAGHPDVKNGPARRGRLDVDGTSVELHDCPGQRGPQAEATVTAGAIGVLEGVEDLLSIRRRDAPPRHVDVDPQLLAAGRHRRADDDVSALGEPGGHQDDGRQRLRQPGRVGQRRCGTPGWISPTISTFMPTVSSRASSTAGITTSPTRVHSGETVSSPASTRAASRIVSMRYSSSRPRCSMIATLSRCPSLRRPARHEPGETEDGVEGGLQVVAHRREEEPPHPLGGRARVDGALLRAGELAEDAAELVGGEHESRHGLEARVAADAPAAQYVRDAGRLEFALCERHVVAEGAADAPPEHPGDRDRDEREAQVDPRPGAQPRGPEANDGVAVGEWHGQLGAALVVSGGREERDGVRQVDVEAVRLRRLDCRLASANVAVDGVEDSLRKLRCVVLRATTCRTRAGGRAREATRRARRTPPAPPRPRAACVARAP